MKKREISLADIRGIKRLQEAKLSPCGKQLAFVFGCTPDKTDLYSLMLLELKSGKIRQLLKYLPMLASMAWAPDGSKLGYRGLVDGKPQIFLLDLSSGEVTQLTRLKQGVGSGLEWSPDGKQIVFTAIPSRRIPSSPLVPVRITSAMYLRDGLGLMPLVAQEIFIISSAGSLPEQLTSDNWNNLVPKWSPDGEEIAYCAFLNCEHNKCKASIIKTVVAGGSNKGKVKKVSPEFQRVKVTPPAWTADGKKIIYYTVPNNSPRGTGARLWAVDRDGGEPDNRSEGLGLAIFGGQLTIFASKMKRDGSGWPLADGSALAMVEKGGTTVISRFTLEGPEQITSVIDKGNTLYILDVNDRYIIYGRCDWHKPLDIWMADLTGENQCQLTELNPQWNDRELDMPVVEPLTVKSYADGGEVFGWVMRPANVHEPVPAVLDIHGGPHSSWGNAFNTEFLNLSAAGYAVIILNPRGSSGYGDAYATTINGRWGDLEIGDFSAAIDTLVEKKIADPKRLGVCGISGGGHLSAWLIGKTNYFKAAVPAQGLYNMISAWGVMDIGPIFIQALLNCTPFENLDKYWRYSPVAHAKNVTASTLIIQSEKDLRCPMSQGEELFRAIRLESDAIVEFMRFPGISHADTILGPAEVRYAREDALLEWFRRYL